MDNENKSAIWETLTMIVSFVLLWAWFLASKATPPHTEMAPYWKVLLGLSIAALVLVLVRRMKRVSQAFKDNATRAPMPPGMPFPADRAPKKNANSKRSKPRDTRIK